MTTMIQVESLIPSYYQDGEDAYFMRKILPAPSSETGSFASSNPLFGKKIWKSGPEHLRLPRTHMPSDTITSHYDDSDESKHSSSSSGGSAGELLGTM